MGITIIRRTKARAAFVRGKDGLVQDIFISEGADTCQEVERRAVEAAQEKGVPQTEHNIRIFPVKE